MLDDASICNVLGDGGSPGLVGRPWTAARGDVHGRDTVQGLQELLVVQALREGGREVWRLPAGL
ncbi:MAG: hypothetical protein AB7N65_12870 [Vicinamibacterales bacterium]